MNYLVKLADFTWQKVFVIAFALCAAYYWLQFDDGTSLDNALRTVQSELVKEKEMLEKTEKAMKDLERFKVELNNQQAQVREVMSFLPGQMNVPELVSTIQSRANSAGLRVTKSEPKNQVTKVEFYEAMQLEIQLQGSYSEVATFLSFVSKLPRLVTIDKISLRALPTAESEGPKLQFGATLVGYRSIEDVAAESDPKSQAGTPSGT